MSAASQVPSYVPSRYLLSSTGISHDELISQYEIFRNSLQYADAAPELVFERLVASLALAFNVRVAQDRIERVNLQPDPTSAAGFVEPAGSGTPALPDEPADHEDREVRSPLVLPDVVTPPTADEEMYLQFWHPPASRYDGDFEFSPRIQASTSTIPVPYGLASGCMSADSLLDSKCQGNYDSRMDTAITTSTLPIVLSKIVDFDHIFSSAPIVAVWLTGLSAMTGTLVSVQATATNITTTQFTVQIDSSNCERLISVGAAWAAWADNDTKRKVGLLCGVEPQPRGVELVTTRGRVQLAAVGGAVFPMEQGVFVELIFRVEPCGTDKQIWNFRSKQKHVKWYSATVVYVMRGY